MKKQYKVKDISTKAFAEAAAENHAGVSAVDVPLVVLDGKNSEAVPGGVFALPNVKETDKETLEIGYRILGMLITPELLNHLPARDFDGSDIGNLLAYFPFEYHKRFGETYSNRVCSESTRTCKCPICDARAKLFRKDSPHADIIRKGDIIGAGFGTKHVATFVAHVCFDGEDRGVCLCTVPLSNPFAKNQKHNSFFDRIDALKTPKRLHASETLPVDYFSCGDGARWITAEYKRSRYTPDDASATVDGKKSNRGGDYWELIEVGSTKEIVGLGDASDIWWPSVGKESGEELFNVHQALNLTDVEELKAITENAVNHLISRCSPQVSAQTTTYKSGASVNAETSITWEDLTSMDLEDLVSVGVRMGGDEESLTLIGENNCALLRRNIAKICNIKPKPINTANNVDSNTTEPSGVREDIDPEEISDDDLPF